MRKIGFTGTRAGLTHEQRIALLSLLKDLFPFELHHGDCQGADEEANAIFTSIRVSNGHEGRIVIHPPDVRRYRAGCTGDSMYPIKPYLMRNRDIVDYSDLLLAAPQFKHEPPQTQAGGTWYTIRYARSQGTPVVIVWPDGSIEDRDGALRAAVSRPTDEAIDNFIAVNEETWRGVNAEEYMNEIRERD